MFLNRQCCSRLVLKSQPACETLTEPGSRKAFHLLRIAQLGAISSCIAIAGSPVKSPFKFTRIALHIRVSGLGSNLKFKLTHCLNLRALAHAFAPEASVERRMEGDIFPSQGLLVCRPRQIIQRGLRGAPAWLAVSSLSSPLRSGRRRTASGSGISRSCSPPACPTNTGVLDAAAGDLRGALGPYQRRQADDERDRRHHHRAEPHFRAELRRLA